MSARHSFFINQVVLVRSKKHEPNSKSDYRTPTDLNLGFFNVHECMFYGISPFCRGRVVKSNAVNRFF